jgi:hypothetical protein
MLSSEWESCPNCPPPCGAVPSFVHLHEAAHKGWESATTQKHHHFRKTLLMEMATCFIEYAARRARKLLRA